MNYDPKGYYEVLEVRPTATDEEIKKNYRSIAKIWHPDQNESEEALEMFQKISVAYDVFKDEKKRLTYDLLSQIYTEKDFPEMFSLKIYRNGKDVEDLSLRSLRQEVVIGKIYNYIFKSDTHICNYSESIWVVLKASLINWFLGFWTIKGFFINLKTIISNIKKIGKNDKDNLKLLVHNALAYQQESKDEQAYLTAKIAQTYATPYQKKLLQNFMNFLGVKSQQKTFVWNYFPLKLIQLIIPALLFFVLAFYTSKKTVNLSDFYQSLTKGEELNYYQEVQYMRGDRGVDDVLVSKIFDIPVDIENDNLLYHLKEKTRVMFAPGEAFDVVSVVPKGTTVRVTGYSPDKVWYRIMLDEGQMGFVKGTVLKKGIDKEIPVGSKISTRK